MPSSTVIQVVCCNPLALLGGGHFIDAEPEFGTRPTRANLGSTAELDKGEDLLGLTSITLGASAFKETILVEPTG